MSAENAHERITRDYRAIFSTEAGQRVLAHICEMGHVMEVSHKQGGDINETMYREGERGLALAILRVLDQDAPKLSDVMKRRQGLLSEFSIKEPS